MLSVLQVPYLTRRRLKGEPSDSLCKSVTDGINVQKIRTWFYNHYTRPYRQLIRFTRRWSGQNAFYHENKARVTELTQQISGGIPGSQAFLGALQDGPSRLWKKLSTEEQAKYRELAKEWSNDRAPKHIQNRYVTLSNLSYFAKLMYIIRLANGPYRGRIARDFQTQLYKTCGVRCVVLMAFMEERKEGIKVRTCM